MQKFRRWAVWQLPTPAMMLVCGVVVTYLGGIGMGLTRLADVRGFESHPFVGNVLLTTAFTAIAVISAEVSMRLAWPRTRRERIGRDLLSVWTLPLALLLPPVYSMVAVTVTGWYLHRRIVRGQAIKRVYTTATIGLAYGGASLVRELISHTTTQTGVIAAQFSGGARPTIALVAAVATWWMVNAGLINGIVALTSGRNPLPSFLQDREGLTVDLVAACLGTLTALLWALKPTFAFLLVPPVLLLQHQLFSGLRQAVRTDLLTEVANPQYWREVAGREVDRAVTSGSNVAILMIDVDEFKAVNDEYGHLAGDDVLAAVARTIAQTLRPSDLVGRLGGEEFGAILSGLNLLDAEGAAERMRSQVAETRVRADDGRWISVTVSVGVSELSVTGGDLRRLLDAADTAMYAAKAAGRNCVRAAGSQPAKIIDLATNGQRSHVEETTA